MLGHHPILLALALACVGALVGWGTGAFSVFIEKAQKLAESEADEREAFEKEVEELKAKDAEKGKKRSHYPEWFVESYGWTRLEKIASPAATAVAFGLAAYFSIDNVVLLILKLLWIAVLIHIALFDIKHRLVLNVVSYPAIVLALALSFITPTLLFPMALAGGALLSFFFLVPALAAKGSVGFGDVKLAFFIGAITGFWIQPTVFGAVTALFWGVLLGGVASAVLLVVRRKGGKDTLAYAPYLCLGAVIALLVTQY